MTGIVMLCFHSQSFHVLVGDQFYTVADPTKEVSARCCKPIELPARLAAGSIIELVKQ